MQKGKIHYGLNWISYINHRHRLLSLSGAKWRALIPLGDPTKKALLEKLMLSSVLLSSILSPTIHTGLQRNVWGWQPEIIACVCESGNTSIPRSTYWAQLRLCCRASSLRRLWRIVWATCRNRQWILAPAWESEPQTFAFIPPNHGMNKMQVSHSVSAAPWSVADGCCVTTFPLQCSFPIIYGCSHTSTHVENAEHHDWHMVQ